jgi:outer membrane putative beta-barrel porin/alpha-amylase
MTVKSIERPPSETVCRRVSAIVGSLACLLSFMAATPAWAGRPLDTEDTATLDPGRAELELSLALAQDSGDRAWAGAVALNAGVAPSLELGVELPGAYLQREGIADQAGVGDLVLVLKHRVLGETEWRPALLANLRVRLPTGDADRGLGADGVDVLARLAVSKTFASLTLTLNGGYVFVTADRARDAWLVSGAGEYRVSPAWTVVAEVASVLGARAAADVAVARGGVVYALTSAIRFDMAVGTGLTRTSPGLWATAGITIGF